MREITVELFEHGTGRRTRFILTDTDLDTLRRDARGAPAAPLLAKRMAALALDQGYALDDDRGQVLEAARLILIEAARSVQLFGRPRQGGAAPDAAPTARGSNLRLARYADLSAERERLAKSARDQGFIPVFWSKTQGLKFQELSRQAAVADNGQGRALLDPVAMLSFITDRPNRNVAYILEDFHHHLGTESEVNPEIGVIRSMLKDLRDALAGRDELVYLLVPASFEAPEEMRSVFCSESGEAAAASGLLQRYGRLMTDPEAIARTKPVIGVESHVQRLVQILCQMEANNPLLIGHPGVGKTAIVEGLARAMVEDRVPDAMKGRKLFALSLNSIVAGTRYRGDLESRLDGLIREVMRERDRIILFIDEMHSLVSAGQSEGSMGVGEVLKPSLARGDFPCIGATTWEGESIIAQDPALSRRFKRVLVNEPNREHTLRILRGIAPSFEKHHGLTIDGEALLAAVELSAEHIPSAYLPGKAVALLDGAASFCAMQGKRRMSRADISAELEKIFEFERD